MKNDNFTPESIFDELISPYINDVYVHEDEFITIGNYKKITNELQTICI